ncbi:cytochrome P450 [Coprinellus micaceus]|uniref:Cytochrome P450 n=1 Tax=Coprinellus micaceus TaxID=71717 RepID=A0A4Y7U170_COPMI|nr:cytochrome P450 [Coprinellus micaceus]
MIYSLARAALTVGIGWAIFRSLKRIFGKNPLDNLPGPPGGSFLAGHLDKVFDDYAWDYHKHISKTHGSVIKLRGAFGARALFVYDPKALHHIIVKDQPIFEETVGFFIATGMIFGKGLFATTGDQHLPIFYDVTHKLRDTLMGKVSEGPQEIDMLRWMSRTALELIGQSGLGYTFDPLTEGSEENSYTRGVRKFNSTFDRLNFAQQYILPLVHNIGTPRFRRWVVDAIPWEPLREMRDISDIMRSTSEEVIGSKRRAMKQGDETVARQVGGGKDIISILVKENMKASEGDKLTDDELFGQVSSLTFAAMDTTSGALSRTLWLLSRNVGAQNKLREEIREAHRRCGGDRLGYDEVVSLPFLDAVCRETLRLYAPVHTTARETREDIILPFSKPVRGNDGSEMHEVLVPKGTMVFPSLLSSNCNRDLWGPDSYEWKPERWIEGLPNSVTEAKIPGVYSHLMTFIGGGRACIGFKFSQLEMKVVLCVLLDKFKFAPAKGKEVEWRMTGIVTPAVAADSGPPQLPLVVGLAD